MQNRMCFAYFSAYICIKKYSENEQAPRHGVNRPLNNTEVQNALERTKKRKALLGRERYHKKEHSARSFPHSGRAVAAWKVKRECYTYLYVSTNTRWAVLQSGVSLALRLTPLCFVTRATTLNKFFTPVPPCAPIKPPRRWFIALAARHFIVSAFWFPAPTKQILGRLTRTHF